MLVFSQTVDFIYKDQRSLQSIFILIEDLSELFYFKGSGIELIKGKTHHLGDDTGNGCLSGAGRAIEKAMSQVSGLTQSA